MALPTHIRCPCCQGALLVTQFHCAACDLTVSGNFQNNEFAALGEEDLHFLRIFVLSEGRIRDMESALGVSYPTIKGRLARLKETLKNAGGEKTKDERQKTKEEAGEDVGEQGAILRKLESGHLSFDEAMARLQQLHGKE